MRARCAALWVRDAGCGMRDAVCAGWVRGKSGARNSRPGTVARNRGPDWTIIRYVGRCVGCVRGEHACARGPGLDQNVRYVGRDACAGCGHARGAGGALLVRDAGMRDAVCAGCAANPGPGLDQYVRYVWGGVRARVHACARGARARCAVGSGCGDAGCGVCWVRGKSGARNRGPEPGPGTGARIGPICSVRGAGCVRGVHACARGSRRGARVGSGSVGSGCGVCWVRGKSGARNRARD
jgi:hypothetical protein